MLPLTAASFDLAAQRAARAGDGHRAAEARLGAARQASGEMQRRRYCALRNEGALAELHRQEAVRQCSAP